ncbi:hypothetical protein A2U01_0002582, partial [Trifolium medium]|nr:hypothetical protein [Trifolium medium]
DDQLGKIKEDYAAEVKKLTEEAKVQVELVATLTKHRDEAVTVSTALAEEKAAL